MTSNLDAEPEVASSAFGDAQDGQPAQVYLSHLDAASITSGSGWTKTNWFRQYSIDDDKTRPPPELDWKLGNPWTRYKICTIGGKTGTGKTKYAPPGLLRELMDLNPRQAQAVIVIMDQKEPMNALYSHLQQDVPDAGTWFTLWNGDAHWYAKRKSFVVMATPQSLLNHIIRWSSYGPDVHARIYDEFHKLSAWGLFLASFDISLIRRYENCPLRLAFMSATVETPIARAVLNAIRKVYPDYKDNSYVVEAKEEAVTPETMCVALDKKNYLTILTHSLVLNK